METRQIKFRAWDKESNKFIYPAMNINDGSAFFVRMSGLGARFEYPNVEFSQFTGLKDKNGKEIYEGDLIELQTGKGKTFVAPVVFNQEYAQFDLLHPEGYHGHWGLNMGTIDICEYKIIGNIYENPELLEPDKKPSKKGRP